MASIIPIGAKWRAQVRKQGVNETKTFSDREDAKAWASALEAQAATKRTDNLLTLASTPKDPWKVVDPASLPRFGLERFCGVYFLFDGAELVYIGQAVQVTRRVEEHFGRIAFDSWSWVPVPSHQLTEAEIHLIQKYRPRLNVTHNRQGRGRKLAMTGL